MFEYRAKVTSVYDADTFRADIDLGFGIWIKDQPIRVYGIDASELSTEKGKKAREFAQSILLVGMEITLVTFKDKKEKYGRYMGKVALANGIDYAAQLVANGYAVPYFGGTKTL